RPAGRRGRTCTTSFASPGRRATRCPSPCPRRRRSRPPSSPPSRSKPRRSSRASSFSPIATSRFWSSLVGTTGKATEQISLAENALAAGLFKDAADAPRRALPLVQDSPRPQLMLGYALWRAGQRAEAIQTLQRLTEVLPGNADAWFNLGNFYRAERRLDDAVAAFSRAAPLRSDNAEPWINLGYVLAQQGNFAEAERQLREAITRFPREPDLLVNLAQVQRATHRSSEALATLERCVQLAPRHTGYRVTRALARLELGEVQAAHAELDQLIREHPALPDAHMARAHLLLAQRQYAAGWRDYLWRR